MTKIKICGLSRPEDIEYANKLKPDYIGFVFAKKSTRYVSPETAARLKAQLSPEIAAVGVFANEPLDQVLALLRHGTIDIAQLHGSEDQTYLRSLMDKTDQTVIKAFHIASPDDAAAAEASGADLVLLDHGLGGTGECFDWSLVKDIRRPYFLAGGLSPENVAEAILKAHPYAVDASTMLETNGYKDYDKMKRFVDAVSAAQGERRTIWR